MPADLSFSQLAAKTPANSILLSDGTTPLAAGIYINVSNLTGDTIDQLSDSGVIETVAKLLSSCQEAQTAANVGITAPNRLAAFNVTNGVPALIDGTYQVTSTYTTSVRYPIDTDNPVGSTN